MKELQWPEIESDPCVSPAGVTYLRRPGVALIGQTAVNLAGVQAFLDGFDEELEFREYLRDPDELAHSEQLCKFAGQLCYMSFGPNKRTWNKDAGGYFKNIKTSGHGSVLEHANFSFLCYGIDRSVTHELVRHRAGFGFSQVSQRYVDGKVLRFVERAEYQGDPFLHQDFIDNIEQAAARYDRRAARLMELQKSGVAILTGEARRDLRKKVNQAARACLPNETEAPIVVTANVRGWRHFCEMRASEHADVAIRVLGMRIFECLRIAAPLLFDDYEIVRLLDGTDSVQTPSRKV